MRRCPDSLYHAPMTATSSRLVLDTNVVLDCYVFRDASARELVAAIDARKVEVLVHRYALEEIERVLAYPQCRLTAPEQRQILDRYSAATTLAPMPDGFGRDALLLPAGFPRCRDRDDEPFLALAYHAGADALVTKDRALLKLRRKARKFGVTIANLSELCLA